MASVPTRTRTRKRWPSTCCWRSAAASRWPSSVPPSSRPPSESPFPAGSTTSTDPPVDPFWPFFLLLFFVFLASGFFSFSVSIFFGQTARTGPHLKIAVHIVLLLSLLASLLTLLSFTEFLPSFTELPYLAYLLIYLPFYLPYLSLPSFTEFYLVLVFIWSFLLFLGFWFLFLCFFYRVFLVRPIAVHLAFFPCHFFSKDRQPGAAQNDRFQSIFCSWTFQNLGLPTFT